ncbi:MAG: ABC transporter ATP-binding protein, partial [Egibacteraceae bacterium]
MIALGAALAVASALPLAGPLLLRAFIDRAIAGAPVAALLVVAGGYVALGLLAQTVTVATTYAATRLAWTVTNRLRITAARHALGLDLAFHGASSPGEMIERVDGDVTAITDFVTRFALQLVGSTLTLAGIVVVVAADDWRLGVTMTVFAATAAGIVLRLRDNAVPHATAHRVVNARLFGGIEERLTGAEDLRSLGAAGYALARLDADGGEAVRTLVRAEAAAGRIWVATSFLFALGGAAALLAGGLLARSGVITVGTVFLLLSYTQLVRRPLERIADELSNAQRAAAGIARVHRLLDTRSALPAGGETHLAAGAPDVHLDRVTFAYPGGPPVLRDLDLTVSSGATLALIGRTGSGKTTVGRLLLRLADPDRGAVRLGGVDLRQADQASLRRSVALVTQDVQLFRASVRDNVCLFDETVPDAAVEAALSAVGLGPWLAALPDGLDSEVTPAAGT